MEQDSIKREEVQAGSFISLREALTDWVDYDHAQWQLGLVLGLWGPDDPPFCTALKHVFWTDKPLGNALGNALTELAQAGVLEYDAEELRFRWNGAFEVP